MIRQALAPHVPALASALGIPRTLARGEGVALTFDDGPHPEGTPMMLELLARAGAQATFFMVGEQVERRPELAAEVLARGHAVALHGYRHRLQSRLPAAAIERDLRSGAAAIEGATGFAPSWHRPPYGVYSKSGLAIARELGLKPLLWSRWGKDWRKFTGPSRIASRVTGRLVLGDVILLHDADFYSARNSHRRTAAALELILEVLAARQIGTVLPV
jgi:peptidoglycan/xylan/chitin deacetylase (PgdA/CDA1 family)